MSGGLPDQPVRHHLVVGVDFGTTNTGVAFSYSDDPDHEKIEVIRTWPSVGSGANENREKAPTEISYETNPRLWGYMFRVGAPRYGWFKLLLDPNAGSAAYNDENLGSLIDPGNPNAVLALPPGKTAVDVCSDYLKEVYAHAMMMLERRIHTLRTMPIKFVITTPAMWGTNAQHQTLVAAKKAGFGSRPIDWVDIVSEPEAAAAYTLKQLNVVNNREPDTSSVPPIWEVGTQLIICDAGGGTVDIVVYEIKQMRPYLIVEETVVATGGLCGATSIDRAFLELVRTRLGPQAHLLTAKKAGRGSRLMESFEMVKRHFGSVALTESQWIDHDLRGVQEDTANHIFEDDIQLSHEDMVGIFDPTVNKVVALVSDVAARARAANPTKPVAGVILVGGFGESLYLYQKIKGWAEQQSPSIFVCNPRHSWAAIVKGAVSYGLEPISHRRILRCHYGVDLAVPYNSAIHDSTYNFSDEWTGITFNNDTIEWFAKMGESLDRDRRITTPCSIAGQNARTGIATLRLRTCRYNEPPLSRRDPKAVESPALTIDLGSLPDHAFSTRVESSGLFGMTKTTIYKTNFKLEMVVQSASIIFELRDSRGVLLTTRSFQEAV